MSKMKSEVRAATLHEVGVVADDVLDAAKAELASYRGAKQAFATAKQRVEQHLGNVDKDVESGSLTLEEASKVKKYVSQCVGLLENLGVQAEVQTYLAQGKIQATTNLVKRFKESYEQERARLQTQERGEESAERPLGTHPGDPLSDRRKAKESAPPSSPGEGEAHV